MAEPEREEVKAPRRSVGAVEVAQAVAMGHSAYEKVSIWWTAGIDVAAQRVPAFARRLAAGLVLVGLGLLALGTIALVSPALFWRVLPYVAGALLAAAGVGLLALAWRIAKALRAHGL